MSIAQELFKTGLLQFGYFEGRSYALHLEMLPSYPQLLQHISHYVLKQLPDKPFNRFVATADTVALASFISQAKQIPLVYSRGCGESAIHDLIGAYDVGHPACLITNTIPKDLTSFIKRAERVGLEIDHTVTLVGQGEQFPEINITAIFQLDEMVDELAANQSITRYQSQTTLNQLKTAQKGG